MARHRRLRGHDPGLVAPFSGVFADRYGHRPVGIIAGVIGGVNTLAMALLALTGSMTVPVLLALSVVQGVMFGVEFPARQALIPQLCKRENLSAALAFNATTFQVGTFLGPVLAAYLIASFGTGASILVFAFTNFWMAFMILLIRLSHTRASARGESGYLAEISAGFRYVAGIPAMRLLFVVSLTSGILLRPYTELLSGFAANVFDGGPEALGALNAGAGFGALVSALFLVYRGRTGGLVRIMMTGAILGSTGLALFATVSWLPLGVAVLALSSMLLLACHVGAYSLIQNVTDPAMRGRVISIAVAISVGGPALGALMIGSLAEAIGLQGAVAASALTALAIALAVLPAIRRSAAAMEDDGSR